MFFVLSARFALLDDFPEFLLLIRAQESADPLLALLYNALYFGACFLANLADSAVGFTDNIPDLVLLLFVKFKLTGETVQQHVFSGVGAGA